MEAAGSFDRWFAAVLARHTAALRRPELLKAIRALSARYVEGRASLAERSALDSAGKRAAFAVFYAPLHFLTIQTAVRALALDRLPLQRIVDLGCGTGVAGAAWALTLEQPATVSLEGVDAHAWAVTEAAWTWRVLGVRGRARRGDLVRAAEMLRQRPLDRTAVVLGWAVNELNAGARDRLRHALADLWRRGAVVLVAEPIARRAAPWWDEWASAFRAAGGRSDEWRFDEVLPPSLAALDEDAGFQRAGLAVRTLVALPAPLTPPRVETP